MTKEPFFSPLEVEFYSRQLILTQIGGAGQQKLKSTKILVVGAGGLGAPALLYLASSGIGTIAIVDDDEVEASNLQRQIIFDHLTIGKSKALSAQERLRKMNPYINLIIHKERLNENNAQRLLSPYDIIIDGSDNFATRYLLAKQAEHLQKPLISGAISQFSGSLTLLMPYENNNPRYSDLFPSPPPSEAVLPCQFAGVVAPVAGVIGSLQAIEAIKLILQIGHLFIGRLLVYNALDAKFQIFSYKRTKTT